MTGWILALAVAQALDASTSCAAFRRGAVEANWMMPHTCSQMVATKAVLTVSYAAVMRPVFRTHPTAAKVATGVAIGIALAASAHNSRVK